MSEPVLRTYTERCRDQRRIEALEAELVTARGEADRLAAAYSDALRELAAAWEWRAHAGLYALAAGFGAILLLQGLGL